MGDILVQLGRAATDGRPRRKRAKKNILDEQTVFSRVAKPLYRHKRKKVKV